MFAKICGWGLAIIMSLQYEMSLFSSETAEGLEDSLFKTRPCKQGWFILVYRVLNLHLTCYQGAILPLSIWAITTSKPHESVVDFTIYNVNVKLFWISTLPRKIPVQFWLDEKQYLSFPDFTNWTGVPWY